MAIIDNTIVQVNTPTCSLCNEKGKVYITADQEDRFLARGTTLIQIALPDVPADIREQLKTGIHGECWDRTFGGMEDM